LRDVLALAPDAAAAHHALGLALVRQKRYDEALAVLHKAVDLARENARFAFVEVVALQSLGRDKEARVALDAASLRFPYDAPILDLDLRAALDAGDIERASPLARRLESLSPDDTSIADLAAQLERSAR
jgi:Flp pilus assembly protein TadD